MDDEEEVIDTQELGLLEHTPNGTAAVRPLKTLTRRSIKPTRLFQSEEQKKAREMEKEEEAATEIEEEAEFDSVDVPAPTPTVSNVKPPSRSLRSTRSTAKNSMVTSDDIIEPVVGKIKNVKPAKRSSPFDSWPRVKAGSSSSAQASGAPKTKKRGASEVLEDDNTTGKKVKAI